ncbi:MAG: hypothetical protein ACK40Z_06995 [Dietzia sp.]
MIAAPATATTPEAADPHPGRALRHRVTGVRADHIARWALLVVLAGAGFHRSWMRIAEEVVAGAGSEVLLAAPVGAVVTAVAFHLLRRPELPIHDRQSDKIAGTIILAIALMIQWLVLPRYTTTYVLLHLDFVAAWLFLLGGSVFFFGLRRSFRYWPAWLLLAVAMPGALRLLVFALGGGQGAQVAVMALVVLVGPVMILGPGTIRRLVRGAGSGAGGRQRPGGPTEGRERPGGPPRKELVVSPREAWRSAPLIIVVGVLLGLAPLPQSLGERVAEGPSSTSGTGQVVPPEWRELVSIDYDWAEQMFGPTATLNRQMIRSSTPRADWDPLLRPRVAAVQTLTVPNAGVLEVFPLEMSYDLSSARVSPPTPVDLGHSVTARYRTVIDDSNLLTWSLLSFVWQRSDDRVQRVTVLTVDNHEYDAEFPETVPGTRSTISRLVSLLLRGSAAVTDTDPQVKDLEMLTELGTELVEAQWTTP